MTLLGLPDAAHECSTILRNLDTVHKSPLYGSVPTDLNFKPNIELRIHEILRLQQSRAFIHRSVRKIATSEWWIRNVLSVRPSFCPH